MAHYGRDYTSGRFTRRNFGDFGTGYDSDFGGAGHQGGWSGGFNQGRSNFDRSNWGGRGRTGGMDNFDESWRSAGPGRGRSGFGEQDWSGNEFRGGGYAGGGYTGGGYTGGGYGSTGFGRGRMGGYGGSERGFYDREMQGQGRFGRDYDQDFGDRLRRGWNRFRDEARGWMGRGYDRGW